MIMASLASASLVRLLMFAQTNSASEAVKAIAASLSLKVTPIQSVILDSLTRTGEKTYIDKLKGNIIYTTN